MEGKKPVKTEIEDRKERLVFMLKTKTNRIILAKYPYYKQINALADPKDKQKIFDWIKKQKEWCSKMEEKIKKIKKEEKLQEIQEQISSK